MPPNSLATKTFHYAWGRRPVRKRVQAQPAAPRAVEKSPTSLVNVRDDTL